MKDDSDPGEKMALIRSLAEGTDDSWTRPDDVQTTFDLLTVEEKKLFWVEGTTRRFDGYNYFGENPEQMVNFFDSYVQ